MQECVCSEHFVLQLKLTLASLELGAGGGLVGLAVAVGCRVDYPIYITDQENMLELMSKNIALNGMESRVKELILNWYALPILLWTFALIKRIGVNLCQWKF